MMPKTGTTAAPSSNKKKNATDGKRTPAAAGSSKPQAPASNGGALEIKDGRNDKSYTVPIVECAIRATELKKIKTDDPNDSGLMSYDPAFLNTASCRSAITYIDGDRGILRYRGYNIEDLAENCTFLEVAYLLIFGELPNENQLKDWVRQITYHTMLHESTKEFMHRFRYDAHPMGVIASTVAALSTVYPEA